MKFGNRHFKKVSEATTSLDAAIVELIKTYGLTTRTACSNLVEAASTTTQDIPASLRRLTSQKIIESHSLHHGRHYFTLTKSAAKRIGSEMTTGGPFLERGKFQAYAKLLIGLNHLPNATPLRLARKSQLLGPEAAGLPDTMMITSDTNKLFWVRIDSSIRSRPSRMAQQLRADVFRITKIESIRRLIRERNFELVLAACTEARSNAILKHFHSYERVGATPIHTITIPELIPLVTSVPIGGPIQAIKIPL